MTTKQDKELLNTIRRAKNAAKRYRYSQLVYISDDGTYSIHQLYKGVNAVLFDMKEIVGFAIFDEITKTSRFYGVKNKNWKAKFLCDMYIDLYELSDITK